MRSRSLPITLTLLCLLLLVACAGTPTASPRRGALPASPTPAPLITQAPAQPTQEPAEAAQQTPAILQALRNAEYPLEVTSTGKALLEDGLFEEPAAPGSATKTKVQLGEVYALGDINRDGVEDALVTLLVDPGGSGTFTYLALVIDDQGTARPLAAVFLGDRILIESLALRSGEAVVTLLDRKPGEPMSSPPTLEITRRFELQDESLVETEE